MLEDMKRIIKKISDFRKDDDFESALICCDQFIDLYPEAWVFYREKADILESLKKYVEAIEVREELAERASEEPCDYYDLSRLSLSVGNNSEAIRWADECILLCEKHQNFYYHKASLFFKANGLLNIKNYNEALDICSLLNDGYGTYIAGVGMRTKEDIMLSAKYAMKAGDKI